MSHLAVNPNNVAKQQRDCTPAVLLSHPTGNQNLRNALRSLAEHRMLAEFWTCVCWDPKSRWNSLLPAGARIQLARRGFDEVPREYVKTVPWREIVRLSVRGSLIKSLLSSRERPFSIIGMYRHFDGRVAQRLASLRPDVVYSYEGGALQTSREAKRLGLPTIYELPSGHWYWEHRLLSEEAERNPEYAELLPKLKDSPGHMQWKDEELRLADYVFVPSQHVRRTLKGVVPDEKIRVVNYGAPPVRLRNAFVQDTSKSLKVLFVGALTQRKGIGYLLEAVEQLGKQVELTLVGSRYFANRRVDEACQTKRWFQSLAHGQVLDIMMRSDVLVLPSLSEGFGLVVTEALACGLPVVVTPNVGAGDLISDGQNGFVVPICSSEAIADRLSVLYCNRELLVAMSQQAQATAEEMSWESYRHRWAQAVKDVACL